jgi:hypothetical protein
MSPEPSGGIDATRLEAVLEVTAKDLPEGRSVAARSNNAKAYCRLGHGVDRHSPHP